MNFNGANQGMFPNMNQGMMPNMNPMINNNQMFMNNQNQLAQMQMNNQILMNQMNAMNQMPMQTVAINQMNQLNQMASFNPQIQNQNNDCNIQSQNENMALQFRRGNEEDKTITVPCTSNEKMSAVISRYWSKTLIKDPPPARFIYAAKNINPDLTVSENGLLNQQVIEVVLTQGVRGA